MHAASVHPEPGSNSRKICIKSLSAFQSFRAIYSSLSFTFVWVVFSLRNSRVSLSHILCFILYSLLFNFQWPFASLSSSFLSTAALLLYHMTYPLSIPFFNLFCRFFRACPKSLSCFSLSPLFRSDPVILPHYLLLVNPFFKSFLSFFQKVWKPRSLFVSVTLPYILFLQKCLLLLKYWPIYVTICALTICKSTSTVRANKICHLCTGSSVG